MAQDFVQSAPAITPKIIERPTGTITLALGYAGLGFGTLLVMASWLFPEPTPGVFDLAGFLWLAGAGLFQVGLVLVLVGMIIRAIYFLPGDDKKELPL